MIFLHLEEWDRAGIESSVHPWPLSSSSIYCSESCQEYYFQCPPWCGKSREVAYYLVLVTAKALVSLKNQRHYFANKSPSGQGYGFSSGHVWMWELDYKESWVPKNWCFSTVVLAKTLESPLDCKEIQPVHPKGDQSWVITGRTDAEAETPILWPPYAKSWLTGKDPDAGRVRGQEEKGMTEDEMAGWHHRLDGYESE